tara:strand:+ start:1290 stop:1424 length:135 start_codon:yes stop_codon:yes gene_type:complete
MNKQLIDKIWQLKQQQQSIQEQIEQLENDAIEQGLNIDDHGLAY